MGLLGAVRSRRVKRGLLVRPLGRVPIFRYRGFLAGGPRRCVCPGLDIAADRVLHRQVVVPKAAFRLDLKRNK